ncbi:MAG: hypothetical protein IJ455_03305 [Agathobacter sp.]|nr:hypothetical protein [Agathobacter sp.]
MENLIEKLKGLDKKILIGAGIGVAVVIILIVALIISLGNKTAGGNTQDDSQAGTEAGSEVFVPEGSGTEADPFIMAGTEFEAKVPAEGLVYYQMYKVNGMILSIEDENAYVKYGDKEYKAENGVVSVPLVTPDTYTPASFAIGNTSKEEKTFTVKLTFPEGTQGNPIALELGDFNVKVEAGNDQGVYYTYTATETGLLTVTLLSVTEGIQYDYSLYNLNTYAMRTMSTEGSENANGNKTVSIEVNKDDVVQISVGTLPNEQNEYPAGEFQLSASFIAGEGAIDPNQKVEYSVTVKDEAGKAVAGVTVNISGNGMDAVTITTDANGVAKTTLAAGTYTAIVSAPTGYKMDATEYKLSPDKASVEVKLEKKSTVEKTYTVKVVNESSKAMSGVLVTVGDSYAKTDSNGSVSFKLVEDNYTATASYSGYQTTSKAFGNSTSVTITLKKVSGTESSNNKTYTVNVVDYAGNPIKDAVVSFVSGGNATPVSVGSNGVATASLPVGNYDVQISFPKGKNYGFDKSTATVSASKTSTTVIAAAKMSESSKTSFYNGEKSAYNITSGAVHTVIQANANNYFVFTPSTSGKYRIRTTNADAKVAYGGTEFWLYDNPDYSTNQYTTDISDGMIGGSYIITVTGASECVLIVERYGSVGETIQPTIYSASGSVPSGYTAPSSVTYVKVSGSGINLVKGSDGYYHKDSATGPIVYANLGSTAPYISIADLVDHTGFLKYFFTSNGSIQKIEEYTILMKEYANQATKTNGFIPLTDDLKYMIQNGGEYRGWWDKTVEGGFYLFEGENINQDIAWMFMLCY